VLDGIEGKVALVTGAARRRSIGRATALRLAREVVAEIAALGRPSLALRADVSDWDQVHAAVAEAESQLGPIDLVANVAGGAGFGMGAGPLLSITEREFEQVLDVNLKGTWIVCRATAERMVGAGRSGRIVNVSSQAGKRGFTMLGAYSAAKAGVILLTQVLASELGPSGITVNAVCPGTVDTNLINADDGFVSLMNQIEPGGFDAWVRREIPLGHLEQPEDVAAAIAFLCSDDAAYITGEAVNVSGGQTMV
jgi:NAD(P)-dependent dehydrogenase (short-subunit alcohol dehydrogenase family)